jgi:hypothetical protein
MPRVVLQRHRRRPPGGLQLVLRLLLQRQGAVQTARWSRSSSRGDGPFLSDQTSIAARSWPRLVRVGKNRLVLP